MKVNANKMVNKVASFIMFTFWKSVFEIMREGSKKNSAKTTNEMMGN